MKHIAKYSVLAMLLAAIIVPVAAGAQTALPTNLGLDYATATGLGTQDVRVTISNIINVAMGLLGIIAVVLILYGGFKWMTSGGAEDKVKAAKQLIIQGVIGLVVILSAYAIAQFVITSLLTATSQQ